MKKKIFMIAVTDEEGTLNRKYTEAIFDLLTRESSFIDKYGIDIHYKLFPHNLRQSIDYALTSDNYEGFIVLLDCLEKVLYNPNVMFELGAIFYLNKPFVVLSSSPRDTFPFDIGDIKIINIPKEIVEYVKECNTSNEKVNAYKYFCIQHSGDRKKAIVKNFLDEIYQQYETNFKEKHIKKIEIITLQNISQDIKEIKKLVSNTAEYIDGEEEAFRNLREAVSHAEFSLRTTRFANESIVKEDSIKEQAEFMESLYKMSEKLNSRFDRIICNNHPAKWQDIYKILFFGGNGAKVYIRKHDFSIHFELVVIDEKVAFIHFYQADREKEGKKSGKEVEKLKSTLRIQGSGICKRLASIFDRLHHRDLNVSPPNPSRTLLGIPIKENAYNESYANYGCFTVDKDISKFADQKRRKYIIDMFKEAFQKWDIEDLKDKVIMLSGIALVEGNDKFIEEMRDYVSFDEYMEAKELYNIERQRNS